MSSHASAGRSWKLFRNYSYVLVTAMGAVANVVDITTAVAVTLYLQEVRGLSPLTAGMVFLAPALLAASAGPISGRVANMFRPTPSSAGPARRDRFTFDEDATDPSS